MADQTVRLIAFVLVLLGGVLALVAALEALPRNLGIPSIHFLLVLFGGILALLAAARGWGRLTKDPAILAIVGGVLVLVGGSELSGALAIVGGILYLLR